LTALRLTLENALETPGIDVRSAVLDAVTEVDRLQDTLDELFVLARTGALPERQTSVPQMLASLEQRWRPRLAERGRRLYVVGDEVPKGRQAPATLEQILDILIDNAATHGRGTVEVTALMLSDGISVEVVDEGDGVSAIPAAPAEPNGASPHGLGLPLARSLVEATGGRLVLRPSGTHSAIAVILP
jgi:signal transduction histidine kinase